MGIDRMVLCLFFREFMLSSKSEKKAVLPIKKIRELPASSPDSDVSCIVFFFFWKRLSAPGGV